MVEHSTRRRILGATATGLTALAGCTAALPSSDDTSLPAPRHYFPREELQTPRRDGIRYTVIRPGATDGYQQFAGLSSHLQEEAQPFPPGLELGAAEQYFRSYDWIGVDAPFDVSKLEAEYQRRGYESTESYRGYQILDRGDAVVALTDGRVIQSRLDDASPTAIKRVANRVEAKRDVRQIETYTTLTEDVTNEYWASVTFRPGAGHTYPGFRHEIGSPIGKAQFVEPTDSRIRCTTVLLCDVSLESSPKQFQAAVADEGDVGYFTYTWPSVDVDDTVLTISEELSPFDIRA